MIPLEVELQAPSHYLLVERIETPLKRGRIWLSPNVQASTRSCRAEVVSIGAGLEGYELGEGVLLSTNAGHAIHQGFREERTLYRVSPNMILARVAPDLLGIENRGSEPQVLPEWEVEAHASVDEGSPEALR